MKQYVMKNRVFALIFAIALAVTAMSYVTGAQSTGADVRREIANCYFQGRTEAELSSAEKKRFEEIMQSDYAKLWDESLGTVVETYHETINKKFNEYIEKSKAASEIAAKDSNSQEAIDSRAPDSDSTEEALKKCSENDYGNYSTYCVAVTLYADPSFGYKGFRDVMSCRKYDLYENALKGDNTIDQQQQVLSINNNVDEASRAVADAKAALDQTLSAYDQLKMAWTMHTKYVKIYEDLIKYRDKLVDMRHYVESFPSKFIDASTTQCT